MVRICIFDASKKEIHPPLIFDTFPGKNLLIKIPKVKKIFGSIDVIWLPEKDVLKSGSLNEENMIAVAVCFPSEQRPTQRDLMKAVPDLMRVVYPQNIIVPDTKIIN